jgi:hypothetical protein
MWVYALAASAAEPDSAAFDAVYRALSSRDPVSCATVEALTPTPAATLLQVVDTATMPPWAPMKAADCLVRNHPADVRERMALWVTDPELAGLGRLVLGQLDAMPLEISVEVARKALVGSDPALARQRALASTRPEIRAAVTP